MPTGARPGLRVGPSLADSALRTAQGLLGGGAWRASLPPELMRTAGTRGKRQTPAPPPARVAHAFGAWKDHGLPSWPRGCLSWGRRVRLCCPGPQARSGGAGELAGGTFLPGPLGPQPASRGCRGEVRCDSFLILCSSFLLGILQMGKHS